MVRYREVEKFNLLLKNIGEILDTVDLAGLYVDKHDLIECPAGGSYGKGDTLPAMGKCVDGDAFRSRVKKTLAILKDAKK